MTIFETLELVADTGPGLPWVVVGFLAAAAVVNRLVPHERSSVRNALVIFVLSLAGLVVATALYSPEGESQSLAFFATRWLSLFFLSVAILTVASILLFDVLLAAVHLAPPRILRDLLVGLAYVVTAIALLSRSGINLSGIVATSAVITAVIGFSLQDTLGNIMGGMALQMERSITVGDWIRVDQLEGRVKEIRWRQTSVETRNWDTVVIPNSVLMRSQVTLLGHREGMPRQRRQWVHFNVDFRFPPTEVIDAVEAALRAEPIPNSASVPPPNCVLMDFKESFASYAVRYWLMDFALDDPTNSVVRSRVYFALRRLGVPLSIPAQSIFVTNDEPERRERKQSQEIERRLVALRNVELFHSLTDDELRELAGRLTVAPFARGETIVRQGVMAHHLYIIVKGTTEVVVATPDGDLSNRVSTLEAGDFLGEMGMMTGEPRAATAVAKTDVECYRLNKEGFEYILRRRPDIAKNVAGVLATRSVELATVREGLDEEARNRRIEREETDLFHRITHFFGL